MCNKGANVPNDGAMREEHRPEVVYEDNDRAGNENIEQRYRGPAYDNVAVIVAPENQN